jgi:ribosome-associated protein
LASTKKPTKAATPAAKPRAASESRDVPKPAAERPRLRSSHGGATPSKPAKPAKRAATPAPKRAATAPKRAAASRVKASVAGVTKAAREPARAAEAAPKSRRPRIAGAAPAAVASASDDAREVAVAIAVAALDKKAHALEILDVSGKVDYADFLVLMSGKSDRQVSALAQGIEDALRRKGRHALSIEGLPHAVWVLMDFGDVVVHVFQEDSRQLYDLDGLWMDARRIPLPSDPARA